MTPASTNETTIDGPDSPIASPMITKMPVPMIAPMPSAVRSSTPTARLSPSSPDVSRRAARWACGRRALGGRSRHRRPPPQQGYRCHPVFPNTARLNGEPPSTFRPRAPLPSKVVPEFRLDPIFTPTADQPKAIDGRRQRCRGRPLPHPARRHRHRQDDDDGGRHRASPAPDARHRAQQDARRAALQRVPDVLPGQRRRVLRLATTTTTSPRRTSRAATSTSRRTRRSTRRSTACATPRRPRCSPAAT